MSVSVRADVFPADVTLTFTNSDASPTKFERARVILTEGDPGQVYVFRDATNGPQSVFTSTALSFDPPHTPQRLREAFAPRFTTYTVETPEGTLTFQKGQGCGCGSRLKTFNPFPTITSLAAS